MKKDKSIIFLCIIFFCLFTLHSVLKHLNFQTQAFDLGIYTQTLWLYSQGQLAFSTFINTYMITNHFEPMLIILAIPYKVFPTPITLLVIQAACVAASGYPLFKIIQHLTNKHLLSLTMITTYFTSTAILFPINFDVHTEVIRTLPISLMIFAWYFEKYRLFWACMLTALTLRDDMLLIMVGMALIFATQKRYLNSLVIITTTAISAVGIFVVIPSLVPQTESQYEINKLISDTIIPLNNPLYIISNPIENISKVFTPLEKIVTPFILIGEYLFLPFGSLVTYLITLPHITIRFLYARETIWQIYYQYNATIAPFLCIAAAIGYYKLSILTNYRPILPKLIIPTLLTMSIFKYVTILGILSYINIQNVNMYQTERTALNRINSMYPTENITTSFTIAPHLANREKIYMYPIINDSQLLILHPELPYNYDRQKNQPLIQHPEEIVDHRAWKFRENIGDFYIYERIISSYEL